MYIDVNNNSLVCSVLYKYVYNNVEQKCELWLMDVQYLPYEEY